MATSFEDWWNSRVILGDDEHGSNPDAVTIDDVRAAWVAAVSAVSRTGPTDVEIFEEYERRMFLPFYDAESFHKNPHTGSEPTREDVALALAKWVRSRMSSE